MTDDTGSNNNENSQVPALVADRYEIGALVGRSAMTETYRATDRTTGGTVAVKFLSRQLAEDRAFADAFVSEAQAAAAVHDPHIVSILDAGQVDDGLRFLVQEYVEGDTLDKKIKRDGQMDPTAASIIAEQLLGALAVAHAAGIIHKDINPANVLMTETGDAKLMDLGIARIESPQTVAQTRAIMGTAAYLSPEQAQGETPDGRADIYAMGIVLYEMVAGAPPFSADSPIAVAYMHIREMPTPLSQARPDVPPAMAAAVMKSLEKKPEDRFQTADEFRSALVEARGGDTQEAAAEELAAMAGGEETAAAEAPTPKPTGPETMVFTSTNASSSGGIPRRALIAIGAVILLVAIGAFYYFFLMPRNVQIPDMTGVKVTDAQRALEDAGLNTKIILQESEDLSQAGTVIAQAPAPNQVVSQDTTVILTVARIPAEAAVPNLVGMSQTDAEAALKKVGLKVGTVTEVVNADAAPGSVLEQDPASGEIVSTGSEINLVVVTVETTAIVPDLTCLSADRAAIMLDEAGLKMTWGGVDPMGPEDVCKDSGVRVSGWSPATGTEVPAGSVVKVWTNKPLPTPLPTTGSSPTSGFPSTQASPSSGGSGGTEMPPGMQSPFAYPSGVSPAGGGPGSG